MAKRRENPPINPLSTDLIAAAVAPISEEEISPADISQKQATAPRPKPKKNYLAPTPSKRTPRAQKTLRVRFPDPEYEENETLTKALRTLMGNSKVTESDITRALWSLARRAEDAMNELSSKAPKVSRPPNGDWIAKAEYDDSIAHFLHLAIKRMGAGD